MLQHVPGFLFFIATPAALGKSAFRPPSKGPLSLIQTRCLARGGLRRVAARQRLRQQPRPGGVVGGFSSLKQNVPHYNAEEKQPEVLTNIIEIFSKTHETPPFADFTRRF